MTVTQEQPTKIGQRVQEIYTDSRGRVTDLGVHGGVPSAVIDWDDKPVGDEDEIFPVDALRVVKVIRCDADWYIDPAASPHIEMVTDADMGPEQAKYHWVGGGASIGIDNARISLLTRCLGE